MLGWFVSSDVAFKASRPGCNGEVINVAEVEKEAERVPMKCTDVDLSIIRVHFSCDAWKAVLHLEIVKRDCVWLCFSCMCALNASESIGCDACLEWSHMKCVRVKRQPGERKFWFCPTCKSAA